MKKIMFLNVLAMVFSANVFAQNTHTLICTNEKNTIAISEIGNDRITIHFDQNNNYNMIKSFDGDCQNRNQFACFQEGQLMVNIPINLSKGLVSTGKVWINLDTDDDESFDHLGEFYFCHLK